MKEEAVEKMLHDKVEDVAGKKVADSSQAEKIYEAVADAVGRSPVRESASTYDSIRV